MKIKSSDHLVLTVADIEATCEFYGNVSGMEIITFGEGRKAIPFGNQKINLHQLGKEFKSKANKPTPGSAALCFITDTLVEIVIQELEKQHVQVLEGPFY